MHRDKQIHRRFEKNIAAGYEALKDDDIEVAVCFVEKAERKVNRLSRRAREGRMYHAFDQLTRPGMDAGISDLKDAIFSAIGGVN